MKKKLSKRKSRASARNWAQSLHPLAGPIAWALAEHHRIQCEYDIYHYGNTPEEEKRKITLNVGLPEKMGWFEDRLKKEGRTLHEEAAK